MAAIAGLIIAGFAYFTPRDPGKTANPRIVKVELSTGKEVELQLDVEGYPEYPTELARKHDATIDITLENSGGTAAYIESIAAELQYIGQVENCAESGGPLRITALYDIRVPLAGTAPLTLEDEIAFQIAANSFDRLALTIGPDVYYEGDYPSLYRLHVTLQTSDGRALDTPSLALISSTDYHSSVLGFVGPDFSHNAEFERCITDNYAKFVEASETAKIISPELETLISAYRAYLGQ